MYLIISTASGSRCWSDAVPGQLESQRCSWMVHLQLSHQLKGRWSNHGDERNHHTHLERGRTWKSLTWSVYSKIPPCNPCKCIKNDFVGFLCMLAHHCGTFAWGEKIKRRTLISTDFHLHEYTWHIVGLTQRWLNQQPNQGQYVYGLRSLLCMLVTERR